ncbi:MAG TPA: hypothetical protein VJU79_03570 [Candidatus Dormibacteraeota bacterium]|nr:hypothetical protein [Candidatus Dormibacteraeota bacterium]
MIRLDRFSLSLIYLREDGPVMSEEQMAELQDRHLAYNADLRGAGGLLINGPVLSSHLRGIGVWSTDVERTRALADGNPSVVAGRHRIEVYPWLLPAGSLVYQDVAVPRAASEVEGP